MNGQNGNVDANVKRIAKKKGSQQQHSGITIIQCSEIEKEVTITTTTEEEKKGGILLTLSVPHNKCWRKKEKKNERMLTSSRFVSLHRHRSSFCSARERERWRREFSCQLY